MTKRTAATLMPTMRALKPALSRDALDQHGGDDGNHEDGRQVDHR